MKRIGSKVVSWVVAVAVTAMLSPVSMSFAAVLSDEVTSSKLKEADGTSGQNTNSGSGVKTGHLQNDAVTSSKIVDGAVTDAKISGTISGSKLGSHTHSGADIYDGSINGSKLASGSIGTANIIDGSVTDAKISGSISPNKIGAYSGVKTVHKGAVDNVSTFSTVVDALRALEGAPGRNAILVMPGTYVTNVRTSITRMCQDIDYP